MKSKIENDYLIIRVPLDETSIREEDVVFVDVGDFLAVIPKSKLLNILKDKLLSSDSSSSIGSKKPLKQTKKSPKKFNSVILDKLEKQGYFVGKDYDRQFLVELSDLLEEGYVGTMGFDGIVYVVKKQLYDRLSKRFMSFLKSPITAAEISKRTRLSEDLTRAILEIMMEKGELIEPVPGKFKLA